MCKDRYTFYFKSLPPYLEAICIPNLENPVSATRCKDPCVQWIPLDGFNAPFMGIPISRTHCAHKLVCEAVYKVAAVRAFQQILQIVQRYRTVRVSRQEAEDIDNTTCYSSRYLTLSPSLHMHKEILGLLCHYILTLSPSPPSIPFQCQSTNPS